MKERMKHTMTNERIEFERLIGEAKDISFLNRNLYLTKDIQMKNLETIIKSIIAINENDTYFEKTFREFDRKDHPIKLYISSYGGTITEGLGLIDIMQKSETPIHTIVTGKAMSMGNTVAVTGDKRYIGKYSTIMIHNAWKTVSGDKHELEEDLDELKRLHEICKNIIIENSKLTKKQLDEWDNLKKTVYIDSQKALEYGLVDEIY